MGTKFSLEEIIQRVESQESEFVQLAIYHSSDGLVLEVNPVPEVKGIRLENKVERLVIEGKKAVVATVVKHGYKHQLFPILFPPKKKRQRKK